MFDELLSSIANAHRVAQAVIDARTSVVRQEGNDLRPSMHEAALNSECAKLFPVRSYAIEELCVQLWGEVVEMCVAGNRCRCLRLVAGPDVGAKCLQISVCEGPVAVVVVRLGGKLLVSEGIDETKKRLRRLAAPSQCAVRDCVWILDAGLTHEGSLGSQRAANDWR